MSDLLAGRRVLLVDDEPLFRRLAVKAIRALHPTLEVYPAANGQEALALLRTLPVDLMITDIQMPALDGFGLLQAMINESLQVPTMVISASSDLAIERQLHQLGALSLLDKPLDLHELQRIVADFLTTQAPIQGLSVGGFVQLLALERKSCKVVVRSGSHRGALFLRDGELMHAETDTAHGEAAALDLLVWPMVKLEMVLQTVTLPCTIHQGLSSLMLEAMRLQDEQVASGQDSYQVVPRTRRPPCMGFAHDSQRQAEARWVVDQAMRLDGILGAAVLDRESAVVLQCESHAEVDMEPVVTCLGQMMRLQNSLMPAAVSASPDELILATGERLHVVRPLHRFPELLVCVVLDRHQGTLAMALLESRRLAAKVEDPAD